jgi:hypothetical protein
LSKVEQEAEVVHPRQEKDRPLHHLGRPQEGQRRLPDCQLRRHLPGHDAGASLQTPSGWSQPTFCSIQVYVLKVNFCKTCFCQTKKRPHTSLFQCQHCYYSFKILYMHTVKHGYN